MRRWLVILALGAIALSACGGGSSGYDGGGGGGPTAPPGCDASTAVATRAVDMAATTFSPGCVRVARGEDVTFTNGDDMAHTVTADAGQVEAFDSGAIAPGGSFQHVFATAGTIRIHCSLHAGMTMTVVVQ